MKKFIAIILPIAYFFCPISAMSDTMIDIALDDSTSSSSSSSESTYTINSTKQATIAGQGDAQKTLFEQMSIMAQKTFTAHVKHYGLFIESGNVNRFKKSYRNLLVALANELQGKPASCVEAHRSYFNREFLDKMNAIISKFNATDDDMMLSSLMDTMSETEPAFKGLIQSMLRVRMTKGLGTAELGRRLALGEKIINWLYAEIK